MPTSPTIDEQRPAKQESPVFRLHEGHRPDAEQLAQCRKDVNKATARRIVDNESEELLARLEAATQSAKEARNLASMANWAGSEREDALRLSLKKLEVAASL